MAQQKNNNPAPQKPLSAQNLQALKPDQNQNINQPKKRHGWRNFFIVLLIVVVVLAVAVTATGLYSIPGLSALFGTNKPRDLKVQTSDQALDSLKMKIPLQITGETADYSSGNQDIFAGEVAVDTQITAEEITSWLHRYQNPDPIIQDLQVRQYEGGLELSGMLNKYIKAPVYAKVSVRLIDRQTVALDLEQGKVGMFNVPDKYLQQAEDYFEDQANHLINTIPGFSIETYELHDGYSKFKGTMPETVKPSSDGWAGLMNY